MLLACVKLRCRVSQALSTFPHHVLVAVPFVVSCFLLGVSVACWYTGSIPSMVTHLIEQGETKSMKQVTITVLVLS